MNLSETALMLAQMQAYDQRTVGESDVIAWHALLGDAPFEDCQEAVRRHYAEQTDRIMPAHVRRLVRDIHGEREAVARSTGWAPGQAGVPKDQAVPEIADVRQSARLALSDLPAAVADLLTQVRADLPEGSRKALMPRRVAWERMYKAYLRTEHGEPNPLYKPTSGTPCFNNQAHAPHPWTIEGDRFACPGVDEREPVANTTTAVCRNPRHEHFPGDPVLRSCTEPLDA